MTYETAKKLKDAGYEMDYNLDSFSEYDKKTAYIDIPLNELIEACGEGFNNLTKGSDIGWMCNYQTDGWWETEDCPEGDTPEEAVASLFLRLNDKKQ